LVALVGRRLSTPIGHALPAKFQPLRDDTRAGAPRGGARTANGALRLAEV